MKRTFTRLAGITAMIALLAGAIAIPAGASSGIGEPSVVIEGPRAVSAFANYNGTVNGDGSSTIAYECGATAIPDAASTSVERCVIRSNGAGQGNTTCTLPGPAAACGNVRTVPAGFTQICFQGSAKFIDGTEIFSPKSGEKCSTINLQY